MATTRFGAAKVQTMASMMAAARKDCLPGTEEKDWLYWLECTRTGASGVGVYKMMQLDQSTRHDSMVVFTNGNQNLSHARSWSRSACQGLAIFSDPTRPLATWTCLNHPNTSHYSHLISLFQRRWAQDAPAPCGKCSCCCSSSASDSWRVTSSNRRPSLSD